MIQLEEIESIEKKVKEIKRIIKKKNKLHEKDYNEMTPRQIQNNSANLSWLGMELEQAEFYLHSDIVKAGICKPFDDDYYTTIYFHPSGFHKYGFTRKHPLKGETNEN